jgi:hypothetical protein
MVMIDLGDEKKPLGFISVTQAAKDWLAGAMSTSASGA